MEGDHRSLLQSSSETSDLPDPAPAELCGDEGGGAGAGRLWELRAARRTRAVSRERRSQTE